MRDEDRYRQEDRDTAGASEPRQYADDEPKDDTDEEHQHVDRLERDSKATREVPENLH